MRLIMVSKQTRQARSRIASRRKMASLRVLHRRRARNIRITVRALELRQQQMEVFLV